MVSCSILGKVPSHCSNHTNNRTIMRAPLFGDLFCLSRMGRKDGSLCWQKEA